MGCLIAFNQIYFFCYEKKFFTTSMALSGFFISMEEEFPCMRCSLFMIIKKYNTFIYLKYNKCNVYKYLIVYN